MIASLKYYDVLPCRVLSSRLALLLFVLYTSASDIFWHRTRCCVPVWADQTEIKIVNAVYFTSFKQQHVSTRPIDAATAALQSCLLNQA
jgi:hypothetical protein